MNDSDVDRARCELEGELKRSYKPEVYVEVGKDGGWSMF